jgi:hypothetical protein
VNSPKLWPKLPLPNLRILEQVLLLSRAFSGYDLVRIGCFHEGLEYLCFWFTSENEKDAVPHLADVNCHEVDCNKHGLGRDGCRVKF